MVRGFARYLSTIDPQTEIPSTDLLRASLPRVMPYLYSEAEITALMGAARELTPRLRAATFETLIGLLAVSALRRGEALALNRADVDLSDGVLHMRANKQNKALSARNVMRYTVGHVGASVLRTSGRGRRGSSRASWRPLGTEQVAARGALHR